MSFDMTTTGNVYSGQTLKTLINRDAGISAQNTSICSFRDSYLPGFSQWPNKSTIRKDIDLLYNAPAYEFSDSAIWIGFTIDNSTATAYDREFHIQNIKVNCIPSTLCDGQVASITAWFDAIPANGITPSLIFHARDKNLEIFPQKRIYFNLKQA